MAQISGKINDVKSIKATLNNSLKIINVYPELESIIIEPKEQTQIFTPEKYGFDKITVNGIKLQQKEVIPSDINQIIVADGGFNGLSEVMVRGDFNLSPENIVKDVSIFGIVGVAKSTGAKITNARNLFNNSARLDYLYELLALCENITDMTEMFANANSLRTVDLSMLDTSQVISMTSCFSSCGNLTDLNISNFDTSNVTSMSGMFRTCNHLTTLDLSMFNTSNVINMTNMFYGCTALVELDVSNFDTSKVTTMSGMFQNCNNLINLDISSFDAGKVENVSYIFTGASKLKNVKFMKNLGKAFNKKTTNNNNYAVRFANNSDINIESLMDILDNLYDLNISYNVANGGTLYRQACDIGKINLAKLQGSEEGLQALANADAKGWNIQGS